MSKMSLLVAVVVAALLGWVVGSQPVAAKKETSADCDGKGKKCEVAIAVDCKIGKFFCTVSANPHVLAIREKAKEKVSFTVAKDFEFDTPGIVVEDDPGKVFECKGDGPGKVVCTNAHANTGFQVFKYSVRVKGQAPLDPWMVND